MNRRKIMLAGLMALLLLGVTGCGYDLRSLLPGARTGEAPLLKVHIQFRSDQAEIECYVKSLGIAPEGQVYQGGSSLNYMYDREGNIIGSYNYQNVQYMEVITDDAAGGE